jgi:hypothetical protein
MTFFNIIQVYLNLLKWVMKRAKAGHLIKAIRMNESRVHEKTKAIVLFK